MRRGTCLRLAVLGRQLTTTPARRFAQPQAIRMTLLEAVRHTVMPWANGLGTTREIAVRRARAASPEDTAAGPGFIWRLSMADLSAPGGAFSTLPGVDRVLVLLSGSGVTLTVRQSHEIAASV